MLSMALGRKLCRIWLGSAAAIVAGVATGSEAPAQASPSAASAFLVIYRPGPQWPAGRTLAELPLRDHGRYMLDLHKRGLLRMAGGFVDDSGGAAVLDVADIAAAKAIADADPAVTRGLFIYELRPWRLVPWNEIAAKQAPAQNR